MANDQRSLAVEVVDAIHGYTFEYSHQPQAHLDEYNLVESILGRAALAAALAGAAEPSAWIVTAKGWGEELVFTADGAKELAGRLRNIAGVKEPKITPLYAGLEVTP